MLYHIIYSSVDWTSNFVPTFSGLRLISLDGGAVGLLFFCNSSALFIKGHRAILWQAVKLLLKLLLQFT